MGITPFAALFTLLLASFPDIRSQLISNDYYRSLSRDLIAEVLERVRTS